MNQTHITQADIPRCLRYLDGCKHLSLPGRWELWQDLAKHTSMHVYVGRLMY